MLMKIISANIDFVAAFEKEVLTLQDQNTSNIPPFNHEKVDASVFLHIGNIVLTTRIPQVLIRTVDTDILTIGIVLILHLELEMWIGSGNGLQRINIPIHAIYTSNLDMIDQQDLYFPTHLPEVTKYQSLLKVRRKLLR